MSANTKHGGIQSPKVCKRIIRTAAKQAKSETQTPNDRTTQTKGGKFSKTIEMLKKAKKFKLFFRKSHGWVSQVAVDARTRRTNTAEGGGLGSGQLSRYLPEKGIRKDYTRQRKNRRGCQPTWRIARRGSGANSRNRQQLLVANYGDAFGNTELNDCCSRGTSPKASKQPQ